MPFVPSFIKRLFALTTGRNASRLSINIAIALCAGLLLPALIGGTAATGLRQAEVDKEMESHLQDKLTLLTRSLADPVWNIDTAGTATIAESALLDPSVVRVTIRDPANSLILQVERPERRSGTSRSALQPIVANDAEIGSLEVETDDDLQQRESQADRRAYYLLIVAMFATLAVLGIGLVSFIKGGEFNAKYGNKLMRARVIMQGVALAMFALAAFTHK